MAAIGSPFARKGNAVVVPPGEGLLASIYNNASTPGWYEVEMDFAPLIIGPNSFCPFPYANSLPWDPIENRVWCVGGDHGTWPPYHFAWEDEAEEWVMYETGYGSHSFQQSAVNPNNGDIYLLQMGGDLQQVPAGVFWPQEGYGIYKHNSARTPYGREGEVPQPPAVEPGLFWETWDVNYDKHFVIPGTNWSGLVAMSCIWWDGSVTGGGAEGALLIYDGNASTVHLWNPLNDDVSTLNNVVPSLVGYYHTTCAYSKIHNCAIVCGGNNGADQTYSKKVYRINSDFTKTALPDAPQNCGVFNGMNLVTDELTGNFLFNGFDEFWELNPTGSGTWTQLADPPNLNTVAQLGEVQAFMSCATPYGPFYLQKAPGSTVSAFGAWLYISTPP